MITTLVIDDNRIIREYFQTMIDWNSLGFDLIAVANNGITGWQAFNTHKPQLVITDVQMPGMSGLELARKIKEASPDTMIVFISNYEDFNYVKSAMDIGAYDYILKHETRGAKFDEKMLKIRRHFEMYTQSKRSYLESKLTLAFSSVGNPRLEKIFPNEYSMIILEQMSLLPPFSALTDREINEIDETAFQTFCSINTDKVICGIKIEKYRYAVLLAPDIDIVSFANRLCEYLYSLTRLRFYVFPLAEKCSINDCLSAYRECREYMKAKFFYKHDCLIQKPLPQTLSSSGPEVVPSEITSILTNTDIDRICELLDYYSRSIIKNRDYNKLCLFVSTLLDFMIQYGNSFSENEFVLCSENDINFWTNADEVFFWLKNKLIQLISLLNRNPILTYSGPVRSAIEYMSENYANSELSVGTVSSHVGIEANKLNKMIKDETGLTIIKWLTNIRIDKSKELLLQNKKLTQIYSDVGYTNISYFSNVFKKVCGVTPLEYRRNTLEKNHKA